MSIIHDALKKVQQSLDPKTDEKPAEIEILSRGDQQTTQQQAPMKNKIKSIMALCCATMLTAASIVYVYHQLHQYIPRVKNFAEKSFYKLINKKELPAFKTKAPEVLKPLAQITINPPAGLGPNKATAPITLNIHGIMSNATGNLVLVNDQVYQEGDEIDGTRIVKINLDSIIIDHNGVEQTIFVKN